MLLLWRWRRRLLIRYIETGISKTIYSAEKHTEYIILINAIRYKARGPDFYNYYSNFSLLISKWYLDLKRIKKTNKGNPVPSQSETKEKSHKIFWIYANWQTAVSPCSSLSFSLFHISLPVRLQRLRAIFTLKIITIRNVHCWFTVKTLSTVMLMEIIWRYDGTFAVVWFS